MTETDFSARIIAWQKKSGRHHLPWQSSRAPYRIWLSEIMLQQTQVDTVLPYFARFIARFPDVESLAAAPVDDVLERWAGLGYYARARNLHACAQRIVNEHDAQFPDTIEALSALPGIGRSTAGAIAALAFGRRAAILDGNVRRVLTRFFALEGDPASAAMQRTLWQHAESLLPSTDIEPYTQGLMDLGATLCTRSNPDCPRCPLADSCRAHIEQRTKSLPAPRQRKARALRSVTLLVITQGDALWLERRPPRGIWGGLLSLPELTRDHESPVSARELQTALTARGHRMLGAPGALPELTHEFTHFRLRIRPIHCRVAPGAEDARPGTRLIQEPAGDWYPLTTAHAAGVPAPVARILACLLPTADATSPDPAA